MDYAALVIQFDNNTFGIGVTSDLTAGQKLLELNNAWEKLYTDLAGVKKFRRQFFGSPRTSITVDANGYIIMPADFLEMIRLENSTKENIKEIDSDKSHLKDGWWFEGLDVDTDERQKVYVSENDAKLASGATLYHWYAKRPLPLAASPSAGVAIDVPTVSQGFHHLITEYAAYLYFSSKGFTFQGEARKWLQLYTSGLKDARSNAFWQDERTVIQGNRNDEEVKSVRVLT